jgi:hypothetical protein
MMDDYIVSEHCDNCGEKVERMAEPDGISELVHSATESKWCKSYGHSASAVMSLPERYTVLCYGPASASDGMPERPRIANQAANLAEAQDVFRQWMRDTGNDYRAADGYGQPCAWVYLTSAYDGISYGDMAYRLYERGIRGGIINVDI